MSRPIARLSNRLYVPGDLVRSYHRNQYTYRIAAYQSDDPEAAEAVLTYRQFPSGWYGFPRGDYGKMVEVFGEEFEIIDERAKAPHGYDLSFTGELREEQSKVWAEWKEHMYGMVQAPPRWGKSLFMVNAACELGQSTLVLAQEVSLLQQWEEELRQFTNIDALERQHKKKLVGHVRKPNDFWPIVTLATWQLYAKHMDTLREMRDQWGVVFVDEAHSASAPCFSKVVNTTNAFYRIPVTATPERKDGLDCVISDIGGPVVSVGHVEQLPVHVKVVHTDVTQPPTHGGMQRAWWLRLRRKLAHHPERNAMITERVLADVKAGHKVLVVSDLIAHLNTLWALLIEAQKKDHSLNITVERLTGKTHGKERTRLRYAAKGGDVDVVLAYSRIVQLGWNVPPWSSLHNVLPMANEPNWYQRVSRIRTPCPGCPGTDDKKCLHPDTCTKLPPVAHVYVDDGWVLERCFKVMQHVHKRLGFKETHEHVDVAGGRLKVTRDPNRKGRGLLWTELS